MLELPINNGCRAVRLTSIMMYALPVSKWKVSDDDDPTCTYKLTERLERAHFFSYKHQRAFWLDRKFRSIT